MSDKVSGSRRGFLVRSAALGAGVLSAGAAYSQVRAKVEIPGAAPEDAEEVAPLEDLMREHGVLRRILLIYEEVARQLESGLGVAAVPAVANSAKIIRSFVEDYHEKLEEDYVFPRFRRAEKEVELVTLLKAQHDAGRAATDRILALATEDALKSSDNRATMTAQIRAFTRMYRPHAAREDTVLFPEFHDTVPAKEYKGLGDVFESRERDLFGEQGFEGVVAQLGKIELSLGIFDLAQFTPKS